MKLDITAKLFLILLAMSIAISATMGVVTRLSFKSQFLGYLSQQGLARVETLVPQLANAYQRNGNWNFLRENPRGWIEFLRYTARTPDTPDLASIHLRMVLLDEGRKYIVGYQQDVRDAIVRPIVVSGRTVGWLALRSLENTLTAADLRFQHRQLIASWLIGGSVALLAAFAALWLSRSLLTPMQRIATATQQLADGDYAIRIAPVSDDSVGRLARDFNRLAEKLQRNELLRRNFMADIAHELRTPLAVLRGEIEAIVDRVREPTPQAMQSLQAEVATLSQVVDDLYDLSLADIGALSYRMEPVDIGEVLQNTLDAFTNRFAALNLSVTGSIAAGLNVKADKHRIRQLFNNLFENMARYTQAPGRLRVECTRGINALEICFHDSGPGVPAEQRSHLFERFYRSESAANNSHTNSGAGLGLAICQKIVAAHGGTISANSSPFGGLLIAVQLPLPEATSIA